VGRGLADGWHEWRTPELYARGYPIHTHTYSVPAALCTDAKCARPPTWDTHGNPTAETLEGRNENHSPGITISSLMHRAFSPLLRSAWHYAVAFVRAPRGRQGERERGNNARALTHRTHAMLHTCESCLKKVKYYRRNSKEPLFNSEK